MISTGEGNPAFVQETNDLTTVTNRTSKEDGLRYRQGNFPVGNAQVNVELDTITEIEDPLGLKLGKKSTVEIEELTATNSKGKLRKFYQEQNETIEELLAPLDSLDSSDAGNIRRETLKLNIAVYGSLGANILLFALQMVAASISGSLALFATMADAFMDLTSSLILVGANYLAKKPEIYGYPSGKSRFETVGIIIFATIMSTLSLILIFQAVRTLASNPTASDVDLLSIGLVAGSLAIKLMLFLYCRLLDHPTAHILAQDHRNDLFVNSTGIALAILGAKVNPYLDPIGAIVIALVILRSWTGAVIKHSRLIVGKCADPNFVKRVTYIAMTHDNRILHVDTCRAYHAGEKVIVEVDIVLPPETTLQESHDLAEELQVKLESLANVERAFVHTDYNTTHKPEHRKFS